MQAPQRVHDLSAVDDQVQRAAGNENRPVAARHVKRLEQLLVQHWLQSARGCALATDSEHVCRRLDPLDVNTLAQHRQQEAAASTADIECRFAKLRDDGAKEGVIWSDLVGREQVPRGRGEPGVINRRVMRW